MSDEVQAPAPRCRFQINDRILVTVSMNDYGRFLYHSARVLDVDWLMEADEPDHSLLTNSSGRPTVITYEYDDFPGEEESLTSHDFEYSLILPRNRTNLLRVVHTDELGFANEILQPARAQSVETLVRWLKIAVEGRNTMVFIEMTRHPPFSDLPFRDMAFELLRLALLPRRVPFARPFWLGYVVSCREWAADMKELVAAICELGDVHLESLPVEAALAQSGLGAVSTSPPGTSTSTTWEHIAAQRDDIKLLAWLLQLKNHMFRMHYGMDKVDEADLDPFKTLRFRQLDSRGRNPLHCAVLHGSVSIVHAYREMEAQEGEFFTCFQSLSDFYAKDAEGRTALEMTSDLENDGDRQAMNDALQQLLRQVHQRILDRALAPDTLEVDYNHLHCRDPDTTENKLDFDYLAKIVTEYDLDLSGHREGKLGNVFTAAENGELFKLKWLVDIMKVVDLGEGTPLENGHSLLQVAARRQKLCLSLHNDDRELGYVKVDLIERWNGRTPILQFVEEYCCKGRYNGIVRSVPSNSWPKRILDFCGNQDHRQQRSLVIRWLIGKGLVLPDGDFIVNACQLEPALALLTHRLDIYGIIKDWFCDRALQAMFLVNEFLLGEKEANNASPQSIALLCVQPSALDLRNEGELTRLILLQTIFQQYDVDPSKLCDPEGRTFLHLAILSDQCLIAAWLTVNFRSLAYTRSANGKLPVHIALEEGASEHICITMLRFTSGILSSRDDYKEDERVFVLADQDGKTVRDYAMRCRHSSIREIAEESLLPKYKSELIEMIANESTTVVDFSTFAQGKLHEHLRSSNEWFPLLHAAIGFGRLDFLSWFDLRFCDSHLRLPSLLAKKSLVPLLRIVCHPGVQHRVGDLVEAQCFFRKHVDPVVLEHGQEISPEILDGKWRVENWKPIDDSPTTMLIFDLRGTCDAVGMEECEFFLSRDGTVEVTFGRLEEKWFSSAAIVSPDIVRLELSRHGSIYQNERTLVMTKISVIDGNSIPYEWRLGTVQEATDTELKIEYSPKLNMQFQCRLEKAHSEWIARDSVRINRSGILKRSYPAWHLEMHDMNLVCGREFADRCGQPGILKWIAKAVSNDAVIKQLNDLEMEFFVTFLSDAVNDELETKIQLARQILEDADLSAEEIEALEASLYVLDRCWNEQPHPNCRWRLVDLKKYEEVLSGADLRPILVASASGRHDRLCWIVDTNRVGSDSPHLRCALMHAVARDQLDTVKKILSLGADPDGDFGPMVLRVNEFTEMHAIDVAVGSLSSKVAVYLLQNDLVPEMYLTDSLVEKCVGLNFVLGTDMAEKAKEKAIDRLQILKSLFRRGARPLGNAMNVFLDEAWPLMERRDDSYVPVTFEILQVLCEYGGDIVSAFNRRVSMLPSRERAPSWLTDYIAIIESDEKIMIAFLDDNTRSFSAYDSLMMGVKRDITAMRDRHGRSLVELAAVAENCALVEWLIKEKAANFDLAPAGKLCRSLGLANMVSLLDSLEKQRNSSAQENRP